jgi:hypothetical protein
VPWKICNLDYTERRTINGFATYRFGHFRLYAG